jgi:hypothetical protein
MLYNKTVATQLIVQNKSKHLSASTASKIYMQARSQKIAIDRSIRFLIGK